MALKPKILTTEADLLIDLLKSVKEISMADAARELSVSLKIVEAWANFLEEEKKIAIRYKFTTPYLLYIEETGKIERPEKGQAVFAQHKEQIDKRLKDFYTMMARLADTDVVSELDFLFEVIKKLGMLKALVLKASGEDEKLFQTEIKSIELTANRLKKAVQENKEYDKEEFQELLSNIKDIYTSISKVYTSAAPVPPPEKKKMEVSETASLIERGYKLVKEGRLEEAQAVYDKIKGAYENLPEEFAERRSSIERDLMRIHSVLSSRIEKSSTKSFREGTSKIQKLMSEANAVMNKGDFKKMERLYVLMGKIFEKLPPGFPKEKNGVERRIVRFYEVALKRREEYFSRDIAVKTKKIEASLNKIREAVKKGEINEAVDRYKDVRELYASLPTGFMKEKIVLQNEIIPMYEELSGIYREESYELFTRGVREIEKLLAVMNQHIASNSLGLAETTYKQMQQIYDSLPKGFLREKTEVQEQILKSYEELISKSEILGSQKLYAEIAELRKLLKKAKAYLNSKDFDIAEEIYLEIMKSYNGLPVGFVTEKTQLRNEILDLYKEVTLKIDQPFLQKTPIEASNIYHEIMRTLIDVRNAIENHSFESLIPMYNHMKILFNELPLSFIHQNIRLRQEIMEVYQELQLYKKVRQLDELAKRGSYKEIRQLLEEILAIKNTLAMKCPEDKELFDFVEEKHGYYSKAISAKGIKKPMPLLLAFSRKPAKNVKSEPLRAEQPLMAERVRAERAEPKIELLKVQKPASAPALAKEKLIKESVPQYVFEKRVFKPEQKATINLLREREEELQEIKRKITEMKALAKPRVRAL